MIAQRPTNDQSYQQGYTDGYIAAFVDAESEFSVSVKWQDDMGFGVKLDPIFRVSQSRKREQILHELERYFECGRVRSKNGQPRQLIYIVTREDELRDKFLPKLERNPPKLKYFEFNVFKEIVYRAHKKNNYEETKRLVEMAYSISGDKGKRKHTLAETLKRIDDYGQRKGIKIQG